MLSKLILCIVVVLSFSKYTHAQMTVEDEEILKKFEMHAKRYLLTVDCSEARDVHLVPTSPVDLNQYIFGRISKRMIYEVMSKLETEESASSAQSLITRTKQLSKDPHVSTLDAQVRIIRVYDSLSGLGLYYFWQAMEEVASNHKKHQIAAISDWAGDLVCGQLP